MTPKRDKLTDEYYEWYVGYTSLNECGPTATEAYLWTREWYERNMIVVEHAPGPTEDDKAPHFNDVMGDC